MYLGPNKLAEVLQQIRQYARRVGITGKDDLRVWEEYRKLVSGLVGETQPQEDMFLQDVQPISWGFLKHHRDQVSCGEKVCSSLDDVVYWLIESVEHCYQLSLVKIGPSWTSQDEENIASAFWFFHDVWPSLSQSMEKVVAAYQLLYTPSNLTLTLFPKSSFKWDNCFQLGCRAVETASRCFPMRLELPLERMKELPDREAEAMGRDIAKAASVIPAALGEITLESLNCWQRRLKMESDEAVLKKSVLAAKTTAVQQNDTAASSAQGGTSRQQKRGKHGTEKWRQARSKMLGLLDKGDLPKTLRLTQKLLEADGFKHGTVRTAAHKSERLREHFSLPDPSGQGADGSDMLLDELSGTMARQFSELPADARQAIEVKWKSGDKQQALDLVKTLTVNPDAGRTGDVALIENADQDSRDSDWSG